ncbi:MAG: hypothetical protein JW875_07050 [Spirochaetales bacterium]|nr:hypothetical protein [Spirochaetales bacterium]
MFEPKVPAIGALVGFVLSFLTGLVSGVPASSALPRALFMALLFAGLAVLLKLLIGTFLPDLLNPDVSSTPSQGETGTMVDFTVGDSSDAIPRFDSNSDDEPGEPVPDFLEAEQSAFEPQSRASAAIPVPEGELRPKDSTASAPRSSGKGVGGLDALPDLQDFVPTVSKEDVEGDVMEGASPAPSKSTSSFTVPDVSVAGVESETMARAIRTILSKDN